MEKRITKSNRFEDIKNIITGEAVVYGTTVEEAIEFIDHELEMLARKNKSDNKKMTAVQVENESHKARILEVLANAEEGMTCTDLLKAIPELNSNQKVSALVRQLVTAGSVKTEKVKGKAIFSIA